MPIDREDGRHWCAPDRETPDAEGVWVCTGCGLSWTRVTDSIWTRTDEVPEYLAGVVEQEPLAAEPTEKPVKAAPKKKGKV